MQTVTSKIFEEYNRAKAQKEALGEKGLYEQIKINRRFYDGNQWYGANCGNDRPLVRHNIIKRIGDFKISQTLSSDYAVSFFADNKEIAAQTEDFRELKEEIRDGKFTFSGMPGAGEINALCEVLSRHYRQTAERLNLTGLSFGVLRQAYITGTGILYTYFKGDTKAGFDSLGTAVRGDIASEVLSVRDVYFGDSSEPDIQAQPYIIIAANRSAESVLAEAGKTGAQNLIKNIKPDADGKVLVLTKLYKKTAGGKTSVYCAKVTEGGVLREEFDTLLHLYPLSVFRFINDGDCAYGESEVDFLIPNQIAVNRMITASVWSGLSSGMPMMIVNGDTVSGDITNDPGQIIKIYGTNEDVAGAVKFVSPDDISATFNESVNNLIENTLTQSGANTAALGDERAQNASAIERLQSAALLPLDILKNEYKSFLLQNAHIWADFWLNLYGNRRIRIEDEDGVWYFPFDAARYSGVDVFARIRHAGRQTFTAEQTVSALGELFDRGVITKEQYLCRLPDALIPDKSELLLNVKEN